jgi:hypothetical protein
LHILTKIFIVLTSLLSVALVPLVMLNTANEEARSKEAVFAKEAAQRLQETEVRAAMDSATDLRVRLERVTLERDTALSEAEGRGADGRHAGAVQSPHREPAGPDREQQGER